MEKIIETNLHQLEPDTMSAADEITPFSLLPQKVSWGPLAATGVHQTTGFQLYAVLQGSKCLV
jgi:hypothetical protein